MVDTWSEVLVQTWLMNVLPGSPCALQCSSASHVSKISTTWCAPRSRELFVVCCYADVSP